jgi:hypothetical protein
MIVSIGMGVAMDIAGDAAYTTTRPACSRVRGAVGVGRATATATARDGHWPSGPATRGTWL